MGPRSRYVGSDVPAEVLIWQDPIPAVTHQLIDATDIAALKTKILENELFAEDLNLGLISIQIDTTSPQIKTNNFKEVDSMITKKVMSWKISDSQTAITSYNLFIDGKWAPIAYDLKNQMLVFNRKNSKLNNKKLVKK